MRRSPVLAGLATWMFPVRGRAQIGPELAEGAAAALGDLIESARRQAIAGGVRPVPAVASSALLGYFPSALLQRARFATGRATVLELPALAFAYGSAAAVTLGGVVLFKTERLAQSDLKLWAHELTYVMQYERWGVQGFADRYVRDSGAVEQEAIDNANRYMAWLTQGRGSAPGPVRN